MAQIIENNPNFQIYMHNTKYLVGNLDGSYVELTEKMLRNRLTQQKFTGDVNSLLEEISQHHQIDMHTRLAGYAPGFQWNNGFRVLVTGGPPLIEAAKGDWSVTRALLERQMGKDQLKYYYTWWQTARWRIREHQFVPLQSVILTGPPLGGKTTDLWLLGKSLGRKANPFQFIVDKTAFNDDLAAAELQVIDDEHAYLTHDKRKQIADYLKWVPVKPDHRVHPKGQKAHQLNLITVLAIGLNMGSEDRKIIPPPFESDMRNRAHIFKVETAPMPMPVGTKDQKAAFYARLLAELPAVHYFLDEQWKVPPEIADSRGRFPCRTWQHPEIVALVSGDSRMMQFRDIVLNVIDGPASLSAADLLARLAVSDLKAVAYNLARDVQTVGDLLAKWRKFLPNEIPTRRKRHGIWFWNIVPPFQRRPWSRD